MVRKKDFLWNAVGLTFNSFNSLFFLIIVNRINGINEAGIFTYGFSLCCLFYFISMFYNRTYQVSYDDKVINFNQFLSTRLLCSIVSILLLLLFCIISKFSLFKILLIIFLMLFRSVEAISDCIYGKIQKEDKLAYTGFSLTVKAIVGLIVFLLIDLITHNLLLSTFSLFIINISILCLMDLKKIEEIHFQFDFENLKFILSETYSIFIFSFLSIFLCNLQKYVMEYYVTDNYQTIFGIIVMPATILSLFSSYLLNPFIILFNKYKQNRDMKKFNKLYLKINGTLFIFGILAVTVAFILGIPALNFVYGIELNEYKNPLLLIIMSAIFYSSTLISSGCLTILGKNKLQLPIYFLSTLFSLGISIYFIQTNGIIGACMAYCLSMIMHFILYTIIYWKEAVKKNEN